ncbi:hypothetical protein H6F98_07110 [Microcoleus sp. FACHB-SPT15]|uniref:hypothetical protein n=1 Tax=Microcoleus sp. FACHB-SPT15 TaxID=2692830 RepID=UPI0017810C89|nr:hypothetical protein [Microcoleus sp. FACHB-SPT15]MBD1805217.1 hypothetical protein [Microcoleus sp. FACHB-SPT15]
MKCSDQICRRGLNKGVSFPRTAMPTRPDLRSRFGQSVPLHRRSHLLTESKPIACSKIRYDRAKRR